MQLQQEEGGGAAYSIRPSEFGLAKLRGDARSGEWVKSCCLRILRLAKLPPAFARAVSSARGESVSNTWRGGELHIPRSYHWVVAGM